jgi:hypothetical protein
MHAPHACTLLMHARSSCMYAPHARTLLLHARSSCMHASHARTLLMHARSSCTHASHACTLFMHARTLWHVHMGHPPPHPEGCKCRLRLVCYAYVNPFHFGLFVTSANFHTICQVAAGGVRSHGGIPLRGALSHSGRREIPRWDPAAGCFESQREA